ncbi:MAG TPA: hypothetical protein VGF30_01350 [Bacteroidia bacterium]
MKKLFAKILPVLLGIPVVVGALLFFNNKKKLTEEEASSQELQKDSVIGIVPPLPTNANQFQEFTVNSDKDTVLIINTGSMISIPKGAFVDEKGDSVKGDINIVYREFHSLGEIILSGIPMAYDSAGIKQQFESGGMFEINGLQNDKEIFIRKDKQIDVSMASFNNNTDDEFGQYKLNKASNKWDYIKKDERMEVNVLDSIKKEKQLRKKISMIKPIPIHTFSIDAGQFPHLSAYKDVIFKVSDKTKYFNYYESCWLGAKVEATKNKGEYRIVFKRGKDTMEVFATNFAESKEFKQQLEKFEKASKEMAKRIGLELKADYDQLASKVEQYKNALGQYEVARIAYQEFLDEEIRVEKEKERKKTDPNYGNDIIFSAFKIGSFGVYNSDCPQMYPKGREMVATFVDDKNARIAIRSVYLFEKGRNVAFGVNYRKIPFDPKKENVLLVVTQNKGIASVTSAMINEKCRNTNHPAFTLQFNEKKLYTPQDINDMIFNQ